MIAPKPTRKTVLPTLEGLELAGKRVFLRADLDAPVRNGELLDDAPIRAALPTIRHAVERGARLVVASHAARPAGAEAPGSLAPAGEALAGLLRQDILLTDAPVGDGPIKLARELRDGQILLLENLRQTDAEEKVDDAFARQLAALGELYVNDAFSACHRPGASITGVPTYLKPRVAGLRLSDEVEALTRLLGSPKAGFLACIGGDHLGEKLALIERLLTRVEALFIGGGMAYTLLAAQGKRTGASRLEPGLLRTAAELLSVAQKRGVEIVLPQDHVAADRFSEDARALTVPESDIPEGLIGLDIGPRTQAQLAQRIGRAKTCLLAGPLGAFEWEAYRHGTFAAAKALGDSGGFTVVVGDEAGRAVNDVGTAARAGHVSTGGAATLEFLEGREMPGLTPLGWKRSA